MPQFQTTLLLAGAVLLAAGSPGVPPALAQEAGAGERHTVAEQEIDDLKAVFATVQSRDRIEARVRTPGTVAALKVDEGSSVEPGQVIAIIADPKLALRIKALAAQLKGLESRAVNAKLELDRAETLRQRGVTPQARVDQLKADYDVAANELKSARAEQQVAEQQVTEGQVLAPAGGRVLKVPVTEGSVMMPGESVATIAANAYLLRLELPERHARFMKKGDTLRIGARGLSADGAAVGEGRIVQVYPELESGRVIADAEAPALGDYFVGERALVWISAGKRKAIVVPPGFVVKRHGLDYARIVSGAGTADIVVQTGRQAPAAGGNERDGIEILSGLAPGDTLLRPEAAQ